MRPSTGRAELLNWINTLCVADYSTVTHLSDAVLYCQVVEQITATANHHQSSKSSSFVLDKLPSFDCNADDYGDDMIDHGRAGVGRPVVNARQLAERRLNNCKYLEQVMRSTAPSKWSLQINPDRLSSGKLQDHMLLLAHLNKWFCSHVNSGNKLKFVIDPVERRYQAAVFNHHHHHHDNNNNNIDHVTMSNLIISKVGPSLQIPPNAPIRVAHVRFLEAIGIEDADDENEEENENNGNDNSHQHLPPPHQKLSSANNSNTNNSNTLPKSILEDRSFSEINRNLDDAAIQLEARREQLERDAVSLKQLVEERDRAKLKLRNAYENLVVVNNNHRNQQYDDATKDPCAGFKMDIEKLFQDASNGRGSTSAANILFKAMQKI